MQNFVIVAAFEEKSYIHAAIHENSDFVFDDTLIGFSIRQVNANS